MSAKREKQQEELEEAFCNGDKDKVMTLLKNTEKPGEIRDSENWTLLHSAAIYRWTDVCQLLVEQYHVDPHVKSSIGGYTALVFACGNNHTDTVKYLVSHAHCDPLIEDKWGDTPLSESRGETRHFLQEIIDRSKKEGFTSVSDYTKAKKEGFTDAVDYYKALQELQERQSVLDKAMAKGGDFFQCNIVFYGPPGAGKSSVKAVILGKPPRPKHKQTATDIVENCVRTVKVDCVAATSNQHNYCLEEVDNEDIIKRITAEVDKYRLKKKLTFSKSDGGIIMSHVESPLGNHQPSTTIIMESIRTSFPLPNHSHKPVFDSRWLHHIDSSGLPQFLDVFTLLYRSSNSHFVVVMRLTDGLYERPKVRYYIEGNDEYCLPDQLVLSNREMIIRMCQVARRVSRATGGKFKPRVFVMGTHSDKLGFFSRSKQLNELNEQLAPIYDMYSDVLISKSYDEFVFHLNTMANGRERQRYTEELQKHVLLATKDAGVPTIVPLKWLILHLELRKCAEVVRLEKCLELAGKIGIKKKSVRAALEFLNKAALVLYYPDDVPDLVITKMDPFTSRLSKLIKASFIAPDNVPKKESDDLREKGVFKKSFLQRVFHDVADNLISDEEFLKLLESLKIAVHMRGDEYFLPSALSLKPPTGGSTFNSNSNPLALFWDELILPHGFFLTVSVELQDKTGGEEGYVFELRRDKSQWRGAIQFNEVKGQIPGVVMLTDQQRWIEVAYSGDSKYCPIVYRAVSSATHRAIERLQHTGIDSPTVGLTCPLCNRKDHYCTITKNRMTCSNDMSKTRPVTANISCWFEGGVLREGQAIGCDKEQAKDTIHDLSCEVSVSSPSIDRWEYGLSIDIDPSSLHPSSRYDANIKVYSEPDEFSFPVGSEPLSPVYSISLEGASPISTATPPTMALKINHFVDPNDVEQLNQLAFAKMTDHSQSQFEIVPEGSFRPGNRFGEIRSHHTSLWSIVQKIVKRGPPLYRGVVAYIQTAPYLWNMYLLVSRYKHKQTIALNRYMKKQYGFFPGKQEPDFTFKFEESKKLKITTKEEMDEKRTISINGWTIAFDVNEITQESADRFQKVYHVPGQCMLRIEKKYGDRCLEKQPMVDLSGIDSEKKYIRIDPPIRELVKSGTRTSFQDENVNSDHPQQQTSQHEIVHVPSSDEANVKDDLKDLSPLDVFNSHTPEIMGVVNDTDSLITGLVSVGVLSEDDTTITTDNGTISRHQRVDKIMKTIQNSLAMSSNPQEILVKFTAVLKNQNDEALKRISTDIRSQLILSQPPLHSDVFRALQERAFDWNTFGRELQVHYNYRESLKREQTINQTNVDKLESVLDMWIQSKCSPVSWLTVLKVLKDLQYNKLLESTRLLLKREDILKKYCD